jgi:hypothetical protein
MDRRSNTSGFRGLRIREKRQEIFPLCETQNPETFESGPQVIAGGHISGE